MANIQLSLAMGDYDHVRDFTHGLVKAGGIDITYLNLPREEIFYRRGVVIKNQTAILTCAICTLTPAFFVACS